ncbi:MAG: molybdopterin-binding protein [Candidatus Hodarchaeota archaeon]
MIFAEILAVGNELLIGEVLDTNTNYLAKHLTTMGVIVLRATICRDEIDEISSNLENIIERVTFPGPPDFVIITGGLGPTFDDLTLEGVAKATGKELEKNEKALKMIKEKYKILGEKLTRHREKMAFLPIDAMPLSNPVGVAPGVLLKYRKVTIICLPGVPAEMKGIFEESVTQLICDKDEITSFIEANINITGIMESSLAPQIEALMEEFPDVWIKSHPMGLEGLKPFIRVHITGMGVPETLIKTMEEVQKELALRIEELGGECEIIPIKIRKTI